GAKTYFQNPKVPPGWGSSDGGAARVYVELGRRLAHAHAARQSRPDSAYLQPGLALAYAMNSGTVLAGTDGWISITLGTRSMYEELEIAGRWRTGKRRFALPGCLRYFGDKRLTSGVCVPKIGFG